MTEPQTHSYRTAMRGTAIFGGVQFFSAIISIIRGKFAAVLIGAEGTGIVSLFNSSIGLITQVASFGISYSGVRDLAKAGADKDDLSIARTFIIINRLLWITGITGAILTIVFARHLSLWAFGNDGQAWSFIWLSSAVLFTIVAQGLNSLLQGMRMLWHLAKSSVIGGFVGLVGNVPLYYFFGIAGIVPAIILASLTTFILAFYYSRRIKIAKQHVPFSETVEHGRRIVKLGIVLVFTGFTSNLVAYLMNLFLQYTDGETAVGLYNSGWALTTQYVGLIFVAMSTDYFPRLSAVQHNDRQVIEMANQQIQIAQLIIAPIVIMLIIFAQLAVYILLSSEFYPTIPMIKLVLAGMLFKTAAWAVTYVILAKGSTLLYLFTELVYNALWLGLSIMGYNLLGLSGIGGAFIFCFLLTLLVLRVFVGRKYGFVFDNKTLRLFGVQQSFMTVGLLIAMWLSNPYLMYGLGILLICSSAYYSYYHLNKMLDLKEIIKSKLWK